MNSFEETRKEIVEMAHRLYHRGYLKASDGNISIRLEKDLFAFTPSGIPKRLLKPIDVVFCNNKGETDGSWKVSSEYRLHISAYLMRRGIKAVIHSHPTWTIALNLSGMKIDAGILPEVDILLGEIHTVPFIIPGTQALGDEAARLLQNNDAVILDRHGVVTIGNTLDEAFDRLERLEFASQVFLLANLAGKPKILPPEVLRDIKKLTNSYGINN